MFRFFNASTRPHLKVSSLKLLSHSLRKNPHSSLSKVKFWLLQSPRDSSSLKSKLIRTFSPEIYLSATLIFENRTSFFHNNDTNSLSFRIRFWKVQTDPKIQIAILKTMFLTRIVCVSNLTIREKKKNFIEVVRWYHIHIMVCLKVKSILCN